MSSETSNRSPLYLVKLGGSLITDKTRAQTVRGEVLDQLSVEISQLSAAPRANLVIGHGSGSFGHRTAAEYGIQQGVKSSAQLAGVGWTQRSAAILHGTVMQSLLEAGVPAFSLSPSSFSMAAAGSIQSVWPEPLLMSLDLGVVPIVYGDVIMDVDWGASISSTESVFLALVPALASRGRFVQEVVWLGETDGVLDSNGSVIPEIDPDDVASVASGIDGASGVDVTGGMRHRLEAAETLARLGVASWIGSGLEPGSLTRAVEGEAAGGTRVLPGK
ncbi:MAG: isopentenyl phosphate kinase [Acidobacteriota bacterium]